MDLLQPAPSAEVLPIANAIAALTSSFLSTAALVKRLKSRTGSPYSRRKIAEKLEMLEQVLLLSEATVRGIYKDLHRRFGEAVRIGDDISRFTLYTLSSQQQSLLASLQNAQLSIPNIQNLVITTQNTQSAVVTCLATLKTRISATVSLGVSLQDQTTLMVSHQNLCPSAALYLLSQSSFSQLASPQDRGAGTAVCRECGAVFTPSKMPVRKYTNASSFVLVNTSGLLRSHCRSGRGWTCLWQLREVSCYSVFSDVKALLVHLIKVHVRDDGNVGDIEIDFAKDLHRRGELEKCGYSVRIEGLDMKKAGGKFVVPRRVVALSRAGSVMSRPHSVLGSEGISNAASSVSAFSSASTITGRNSWRQSTVSVLSVVGSVISGPPPYTELPFYAASVVVPEEIGGEGEGEAAVVEEIHQVEGNAVYEMEHPSYELDSREVFEIGGSVENERERRGRRARAINAVRQLYIAYNPGRIGRIEEGLA